MNNVPFPFNELGKIVMSGLHLCSSMFLEKSEVVALLIFQLVEVQIKVNSTLNI